MKLGGSTQFGSGSFGGEPYGADPGYICSRIITALSRFQMVTTGGVTTGSVRTIKRFAGELVQREDGAIDLLLAGGLPAMLVGYFGGTLKPRDANGRVHEQTLGFSIYCGAGQFRDQEERLEGRNVYQPGLDNLLRWACYFAGRELMDVKALRKVRPASLRYLIFEPEKYVGVVDFEAVADFDLFDDEPQVLLTKLGLVHDPLDYEQLFEGDNVTPNTDTVPSGGVAEL